jgi:hypothetical protein
MEYLEFDGCEGFLSIQSTGVNTLRVKQHRGVISSTTRNVEITDSTLDQLVIGSGLFGCTDSIIVRNTRCTLFDWYLRDDGPTFIGSNYGNNVLANWTFSNGTFSRNLNNVPAGDTYQNWAIPGAKFFVSDEAAAYNNMGSPFAILNVYMSGGVFSFDTTLKAIPTIQTQSTVTITIASPGVVTWTAHGLAAGAAVLLQTTGALPTGLSPFNTLYFVAAVPAPTANTFSLATSVGGTAINTTGTQSGTHTAVANPLHINPHPCPRFTGQGNTGTQNIIDLNGAVDEPIFSRLKRSFVGKTNTDEINYQFPTGRIWGTLVSCTVNVLEAWSSGTLVITCPGFVQPNLTLHTFSQTIDLTRTGIRTITPGGTTGGGGADVLTAYGDWLSGGTWGGPAGAALGNAAVFQMLPSGTPSGGTALSNNGIVEIEVLTDQGITRQATMFGYDTQSNATNVYLDSSIQSFNPITP